MVLPALWLQKAKRFLRRGRFARPFSRKRGQWQIADESIPVPKLRRMVQHIPEDVDGDELSRAASLDSVWEDSPSRQREFEYSIMRFEDETVLLKRPYRRRVSKHDPTGIK